MPESVLMPAPVNATRFVRPRPSRINASTTAESARPVVGDDSGVLNGDPDGRSLSVWGCQNRTLRYLCTYSQGGTMHSRGTCTYTIPTRSRIVAKSPVWDDRPASPRPRERANRTLRHVVSREPGSEARNRSDDHHRSCGRHHRRDIRPPPRPDHVSRPFWSQGSRAPRGQPGQSIHLTSIRRGRTDAGDPSCRNVLLIPNQRDAAAEGAAPMSRPTGVLTPNEQRARVAAVRGFVRAREQRFEAATSAFAEAATLDPGLD